MVVLLFVTAQFDAAVCAFTTTLRKIYFAPALARTRVIPFPHLLLASYTNCALQHDFQHITQCRIHSKTPTLTCTNCTCTCTNLHGAHRADFSVIRCGNFSNGRAYFLLREGDISVGGNGCTACYYRFCAPSCRPQR